MRRNNEGRKTNSRRALLRTAVATCFAANFPLTLAKANPMQSAKRPTGPGLIFGPGNENDWDSERVSCPKVIREADGRWKMWYYGRDPDFDRQITLPTGRVGLATSDDGIDWQRVRGPLTKGAVFEPHPDPERFDSGHVGISDIHYRDGLYWMWYFGGDNSVQELLGITIKGFPMRPGCAVSGDGINWTRLEGPVRGAMLDAGAPGTFDANMVAWPQVIPWDDGSWRMYYHGIDNQQRYILGWAESDDGLLWEKRYPIMGPGSAGDFDDLGVATRHILKLDGRWTMFYEGCRNIGSRVQVDREIGVAVSDDGITWKRMRGPHDRGSILAQTMTPGGWDRRLGCPHVVPMPDGSLRMYYIGSNERDGDGELDTVNQIGVAVSDGDVTRWTRLSQA